MYCKKLKELAESRNYLYMLSKLCPEIKWQTENHQTKNELTNKLNLCKWMIFKTNYIINRLTDTHLSGSLVVVHAPASPSAMMMSGGLLATEALYFEVCRCCRTRPKSETLRPRVTVIRGFRLGESWVLGSHQTLALVTLLTSSPTTAEPRFSPLQPRFKFEAEAVVTALEAEAGTTTHLTFCSGESAFTNSMLVLEAMLLAEAEASKYSRAGMRTRVDHIF